MAFLLNVYIPKLIPLDEIRVEIIPKSPGVLLAVAVLMIAVGLLAPLGPARRGFRIQPTEALREGG